MKIKILNNEEIEASISLGEIVARGLKISDFKKGSEVVTALIEEIVEKAKDKGFQMESSALSIYVEMTMGGINLNLRKVSQEEIEREMAHYADEKNEEEDEEKVQPEQSMQKSTIFRFNNLCSLLDFVTVLEDSSSMGIYEDRNNKEFYLVMRDVENNPHHEALVTEYCTGSAEKISETYVKEHYTLFLQGDSIYKLKEVLR